MVQPASKQIQEESAIGERETTVILHIRATFMHMHIYLWHISVITSDFLVALVQYSAKGCPCAKRPIEVCDQLTEFVVRICKQSLTETIVKLNLDPSGRSIPLAWLGMRFKYDQQINGYRPITNSQWSMNGIIHPMVSGQWCLSHGMLSSTNINKLGRYRQQWSAMVGNGRQWSPQTEYSNDVTCLLHTPRISAIDR